MATTYHKLNNNLYVQGDITLDGTVDGRDVALDGTNQDTHISATSGIHGITGSFVGNSDAQTLTNKTIDADQNTITNIDNADIKASAGIDATKIANGSISNAEFQQLNGVTSLVLGISDVQTLTNKTIDADLNTLSNIDNADIKASAGIDATKIADGSVSNAEFQQLNGITSSAVGISDAQTLSNKTLGNNLDANSFKVINLATPVSDGDAASKGYVDGVATGLDIKDSVKVASTVDLDSNTSISGVITYNATAGTSGRGQITATLAVSDQFTVDGVNIGSAQDGSRVLLKDQTSGAQNGIWTTTVSGTSLTLDRATDFDEDNEVTSGAFTFIEEGTVNADSGWTLTTNNPITIGGASGTAITLSQFSGAGQTIAGTGMTKTGNTLNVIGSSTIIANADSVEVNSSATANQVLLSSGSVGTASTFGALPLGNSDAVTGVLPVSNGGVGASSLTSGNFLQGNGTSAVTATKAVPTGDVVGTSDSQVLENKTFTDLLTFWRDNVDNTKKLQLDVSNVTTSTTRTLSVPDANTTIVGHDTTQTLTNKTIDADQNTITNIENADIKASAGIDATKIADGSISNTEFQYLNGASSNIQTQIDNHSGDTTNPHSVTASQVGNTTAQWNANQIQGTSVDNTAPTDGQHMVYDALNTQWAPGRSNKDTTVIFDDFISSSLSNSWLIDLTGGSSNVDVIDGLGGQVNIISGSATNDYAELRISNKTLNKSGNFRLTGRFKLSSTTNSLVEFGAFIDSNNLIRFKYNVTATPGNWFGETINGGTSTDTDTTIAVDGNWHIFEIISTNTNIKFYIDSTLRATNSTNLPSGLMRLYLKQTSNSASSRTVTCDYIEAISDRDSS